MENWPRWTGAILEALVEKHSNTQRWLVIRSLWAADPDRALQRTAAAYPEDPTADSWVTEGWSHRREEILRIIEQHSSRELPEWARHWLARQMGDTPGDGADRIFALLTRLETA